MNIFLCSRFVSIRSLRSIRVTSTRLKMTAAAVDIKQLGATRPLVAVVQICATPDKDSTFAQVVALVEKAKKRGAEVC